MQWLRARDVGLILAMLAFQAALAAEPIDPIGRPPGFDQGKVIGYAVWHEGDYWELRVTSRDRPGAKRDEAQVFAGSVTVEGGTILEGQFDGMELRRQARESDWLRMHPGKQGFNFHFVAKGKTDSLKFKVSRGAKSVKFELLTNGDTIVERVHIGAAGVTPPSIPFELPAHPTPPEPATPAPQP